MIFLLLHYHDVNFNFLFILTVLQYLLQLQFYIKLLNLVCVTPGLREGSS